MGEPTINRYYWLDVTKFMGIFLIVLCHLPLTSFTQKFLWTFHVPLFFFISGYLFKATTRKDFIAKMRFRLVLPYIYIYLLSVLLKTLITADFDGGHFLKRVLGLFWGTHSYPDFINSALWFLPGLMVVQILYFFLVKKHPLSYFALLAVSVYLYLNAYLNLFFSIDLALLGLNFFMVGCLVKKYALIEWLKTQPMAVAVLFAASLLITLDFAWLKNVWYGGTHYSLSFLGGVIGICMMVSLALLLERYSRPVALISYISSSTLCIFCFHLFSNPVAKAIVDTLGIQTLIVSALLATVLSIALLLPVNWLIVKYVPELVGIKRGA
ncbi:MAG: acyltransferase family protein [Methylococcaceae bacterium]|nr:acyltransferase family protein [Methylococcaceae bacterium]